MKIENIMTPCPYRIDGHAAIAEAQAMMALNGVRHLPVFDKEEIVGVLSENDIRLSINLRLKSGGQVTVGEACSRDPFVVSAARSAAEVLKEMADQKVECALVANEDDRLVGIFTLTDACLLAHRLLLESRR